MSASFLIDEGQRAVFSRGAGVLTHADLIGHMDRLLADARFRPDMRQIVDFGDVAKIELTGDQIRQLASRKIFGPGSSRAFVAPGDVAYGLARMFQAHRESNGETGIAIFRGMAEAVSWIGLPADLVDRAFAELRKADAGSWAREARQDARPPPMQHQLAQVNIARARGPLDGEVMRGFMEALDEINALAEGSPGFVWRFKTDSGNATSVRAYADPRILVNLSVWESVEALRNYAYRSRHGAFFARRADWFERLDRSHLALWWVPRGTLPTLEEAVRRLEMVAAQGDTPSAFTFAKVYTPEGVPAA